MANVIMVHAFFDELEKIGEVDKDAGLMDMAARAMSKIPMTSAAKGMKALQAEKLMPVGKMLRPMRGAVQQVAPKATGALTRSQAVVGAGQNALRTPSWVH